MFMLLDRQKLIGPITEKLYVCCHSNIHGVCINVLNVTIRINESIEGWAPVTVIRLSPISRQQGTTVNIGHLDGRHYVSHFSIIMTVYQVMKSAVLTMSTIIQSLVIID